MSNDEKSILDQLENKTIIADGTFANEVNYISNQIHKQQELLIQKTLVDDILDAYKGTKTWGQYLKERKDYNEEVRRTNDHNMKIFKTDESAFKLEYRIGLPIIDYAIFMYAEIKGKKERGENENVRYN